jgi:type IV secretion system protein VirB10
MAENEAPMPVPKPKENAQDLLRTPTPRPARYKKALILSLSLGAMACVAGALTYGMMQGPHAGGGNGGVASSNLPSTQTSDSFAGLPNSYSQVTAPKPQPITQQATIQPRQGLQTGAGGGHGPGADQINDPNSPAALAAKATSSNIFFTDTTDQSAQSAASPSSPTAPVILPTSAGATAAAASSGSDDPGQQSEKSSFITGNAAAQSSSSDYTGTPLETPASAYEVQAGEVIPAALLTAINSDLPGDVTAQVTEDVYDSATGNYLLIPQGARLYGRYDSLVSYGQNRALVVWNRIIFPNGKSIDLGGMIGTDATGESGLQDQTNHHILGLTAALATATLVSFGPSLALDISQNGNTGSTNIYTNPAQTLGQSVNNIGQEFVSKELNRPNTITIRAGWPLRVMVNKDMILEPYTP